MPPKAKSHTAATPAHGSSPFTLLSGWVRQGTESFFATQRVLLDLVMRQNANTMHAVRERLNAARAIPGEVLTEVAGEGVSNFVAAQRVLLHLAERQNEIVMTGVKERTGGYMPLAAMTDLVRRSVDTFIDMQQHFLSLAAKQTDAWIDAAKSGERFAGEGLAELAREGMENFVRSQKKFLDVIAEETAHATGVTTNGKHAGRKTEVPELARQAAEAFIDAQKKLLDVATQQMAVNMKTARKTMEVVNPLPAGTLKELTQQTVDGFVAAQKALLDLMPKSARAPEAHPHTKAAPHKAASRKRPARAHRAPVSELA
jgi:hypothetical protein